MSIVHLSVKDKYQVIQAVTFSSPSWRSRSHWKGSLNHPKKVTRIARYKNIPHMDLYGGRGFSPVSRPLTSAFPRVALINVGPAVIVLDKAHGAPGDIGSGVWFNTMQICWWRLPGTHRIHVWYIYLHDWLISMGNVGYTDTIHGWYGVWGMGEITTFK